MPYAPFVPLRVLSSYSMLEGAIDPKAIAKLAKERGFPLFPKEEFSSVTLNCLKNEHGIQPDQLNRLLKSIHGFVIDGGYGKLKGKTFRISNMGDETDETIAAMLKAFDAAFAETPKVAAA